MIATAGWTDSSPKGHPPESASAAGARQPSGLVGTDSLIHSMRMPGRSGRRPRVGAAGPCERDPFREMLGVARHASEAPGAPGVKPRQADYVQALDTGRPAVVGRIAGVVE